MELAETGVQGAALSLLSPSLCQVSTALGWACASLLCPFSDSYFFPLEPLHTPSIVSLGSAVAAFPFLQHQLHGQVQQQVQGGDVQQQQQQGQAALCPGLLCHPALPAPQCQRLR